MFSSDHESANVNLTILHDGVGFLFAQNLGKSEFITQHGWGGGGRGQGRGVTMRVPDCSVGAGSKARHRCNVQPHNSTTCISYQ